MNGNTRLVEKSWEDAKQLCLNYAMTTFILCHIDFQAQKSLVMGFKMCWKVIKFFGLLSNLS
jgi:hypothetical protein